MKCPHCDSSDVRVTSSRHTDKGSVTRWRKCLTCDQGWSTVEIVIPDKACCFMNPFGGKPHWHTHPGALKKLRSILPN